ncbi:MULTISPECIES: SusC/RagA family TonB-linked outer membrane protein [Chryseobacterium]|uniref:SusC/RagA family TonB-linked outer membrane protein n=1 Tax=Candidatus Chryseobacterium massiliense TaxID=204089 RepID=A0A3D9BES6_9FLAO|nr:MULTISPECIES: SusC/RagA family TonB-linked outer membrane protein [Chryseobacterium]REC51861.1 SusC/RagA family TonB-linked outer membrane protein [Candidatus Chryseobacterium massiliae]
MKKLTAGILILVLSSSLAVSNAQQKKNDTVRTQEIEGVVVTALGIKRDKKSLGYSTQQIKADAITDGVNTGNIANQLVGKAAGLNVSTTTNFGGSANIVIRGNKSIVSNNQALIVIDGVPIDNRNNFSERYDYGNNLSDINQADIESVNVLKGAAASALYGERAGNGVILITTKKGRSRNGRVGITLSSEIQVGAIDRNTFAKYQDKYGAGYGQYFDEDAAGNLYAPFYDDASLGNAFNPNLMVYQWDSYDPNSPNFGKAYAWQAAKHTPADFFETATNYVNTVSLESGNNDSNILVNYTNFLSNGVLPNSEQKKNTISAKFNHKFNDKFDVTTYASLTLQDTKGRNSTGYGDNIITGFRQWWQNNVDIYSLRDAYSNSGGQNITWNRVSADDGSPKYWNNPYFDRYQNYQTDKRNRFFGYLMLNYKVTPDLTITGRMSSDTYDQKNETRKQLGSMPESFGLSGKSVSSGYELENIRSSEINFDVYGAYNKKFDDLSVTGLLGTSYRRNYIEAVRNSTEGGLILPNVWALNNTAEAPLPAQEDLAKNVTMGAYAQASLGYKDTYFVEGSYRVDKSSNLAQNSNVYGYPSVSASVILSNLINQDWLSFLKLRGNYAKVGKSTDNYRLFDQYTILGIFGKIPMVSANTVKNNPNLKPESSNEYEFGLEGSFLKNRIGFDVAYYDTRTINQIVRADVSNSTGYASQWLNAGEIQNKGIEVSLNLTPFKSKNFSWDINLNWSKNKSSVLKLTEGLDNLLLQSVQGEVSYNAFVGQPFGIIKGTDYVYLNGQPVVEDGVYARAEDQVIGNINPDWIGGIRNTISYKGVSLSFLIDGQKGGDIFSTDLYYGLGTGIYPETAFPDRNNVILAGVNPDGTPNTTPIPLADTGELMGGISVMPAKAFIYDASFIKLREASLTFNLPKDWYSGTFINDMKFSIIGRNLWIIHKNLPYADPESGLRAGLLSRGYSVGAMPTVRTFGFNFTAKF